MFLIFSYCCKFLEFLFGSCSNLLYHYLIVSNLLLKFNSYICLLEYSEHHYLKTIFLVSKSLRLLTAAMRLKDTCSLEEKLWQTQTKKQRHHFADKGLYSQGYGSSSSHVWMWELAHIHKEGWVPKKWCFWTVVLEKTLESPLDCKEIQPVHPKGNQSWIFTETTDAEAETPILGPHDANRTENCSHCLVITFK